MMAGAVGTTMRGTAVFLGRHWRGALSPLAAWLVGGMLAALLLAAAARLALIGLSRLTTSLRVTTLIELAWFVVAAMILAWATVGIWRSLAASPLRMKLAGRALLILLLLAAGSRLPDRYRTASELFQIARGLDPLGPPAAMRAAAGEILIDGPLSEGAGARFAAILADYPKAGTVVLRSIGGRMMEAQSIANAIRAAGLKTHARDYCLSACTVVLAAGRERSASYAARIGFHQATMDGYSDGENRLFMPLMRDALDGAGVDRAFARRAAETPAAGMWYPTHREMLDARFLNRQDMAAQLADIARLADATRGQRIEDHVVFEGASATGTEIRYRYRLMMADRGRDGVAGDVVSSGICADDALRALITEGATVRHAYSDRRGALLGEVRVATCPAS